MLSSFRSRAFCCAVAACWAIAASCAAKLDSSLCSSSTTSRLRSATTSGGSAVIPSIHIAPACDRLRRKQFYWPDTAVLVTRFLDEDGVGEIDLSTYDGDGNPNASAIRILNVAGASKAFVALERLDDRDMLRSKQPSWMLQVDVGSRTPEETKELAEAAKSLSTEFRDAIGVEA